MIEMIPKTPFVIGNIISIIPLMVYITYFDKNDDRHWLGMFGVKLIKFLRK